MASNHHKPAQHSQLDRQDFVRLAGKEVGTTLQDLTIYKVYFNRLNGSQVNVKLLQQYLLSVACSSDGGTRAT